MQQPEESDNPYLEHFLNLPRDRYGDTIRYAARGESCKTFAWAIPNDAALDAIARYSPIVEIGAGSGYWCSCLEDRGADVIAYDIEPAPSTWADISYFDVAPGGPEMAARHPDRALFLCWPPYNDPMAAEALAAYTGNHVLYVGESNGGCTADDAFHHALLHHWEQITEIPIPQWDGIHDYLTIWQRI